MYCAFGFGLKYFVVVKQTVGVKCLFALVDM